MNAEVAQPGTAVGLINQQTLQGFVGSTPTPGTHAHPIGVAAGRSAPAARGGTAQGRADARAPSQGEVPNHT